MDLTKIIETSAFYFDDSFDAADSNELLYRYSVVTYSDVTMAVCVSSSINSLVTSALSLM